MKRKSNALENLEKVFSELHIFSKTAEPSKLERAGIIQAFEFTFELIWKVFKVIAEEEGLSAPSPKSAFKQAYKMGIIQDEAVWIKLLESRNLTTHTYNEELAESIYRDIVNLYVPEFARAIQVIKLRHNS